MELLEVDYAWLDWVEVLYRDPELSDVNDFSWEPGTSVVSSRDAVHLVCRCITGISRSAVCCSAWSWHAS
jgi:hypothetical protein